MLNIGMDQITDIFRVKLKKKEWCLSQQDLTATFMCALSFRREGVIQPNVEKGSHEANEAGPLYAVRVSARGPPPTGKVYGGDGPPSGE